MEEIISKIDSLREPLMEMSILARQHEICLTLLIMWDKHDERTLEFFHRILRQNHSVEQIRLAGWLWLWLSYGFTVNDCTSASIKQFNSILNKYVEQEGT